MFSASRGAMEKPNLTAKRSFTRTTLTDLQGSLRISVDASISAVLGSLSCSLDILSAELMGMLSIGVENMRKDSDRVELAPGINELV